MIELVNASMDGIISPFLKVLITLFFVGGVVYIIVMIISFIFTLVYDYKNKKQLRDLDEYINNHTSN